MHNVNGAYESSGRRHLTVCVHVLTGGIAYRTPTGLSHSSAAAPRTYMEEPRSPGTAAEAAVDMNNRWRLLTPRQGPDSSSVCQGKHHRCSRWAAQ